MDTFTLVVFLILIMIAINQGLTWIAGGLLVMLIITMRSMGLLVLAVVGLLVGFMFKTESQVMWVIVAMIVIAVIVFKEGQGAGPEAYSPQMLMGG